MSEEIKERIIRVLINLGVLFLIVTASGLSIPSILASFSILPAQGLSFGTVFMLILVVISAFLALRILMDIMRLFDLTSEYLIKYIPGLKTGKGVSITRALKEIAFVLILVLLSTLISPVLLMIPHMGPWLALAVSLIILVTSVLLIYDAGRTLYAIFESGIQLFIDKLSGSRDRDSAQAG